MHHWAIPEEYFKKAKGAKQGTLDDSFKKIMAKMLKEFQKEALLDAIVKLIVCDDQVSIY